MFGAAKSKGADKEKEREAEARKLEAMKQSVRAAVANVEMHALAPNPERTEAAANRVTELLKNPKIPNDFSKEMRRLSDTHLLNCFMKAASEAASQALHAAHEDEIELRSKKIGEARKLLARAIQLKAPADFKAAVERSLEAAAMTGGMKQKGPTKAKPLDTAPKVLNRAKGEAPMKFEEAQQAEAEAAEEKAAEARSAHAAAAPAAAAARPPARALH